MKVRTFIARRGWNMTVVEYLMSVKVTFACVSLGDKGYGFGIEDNAQVVSMLMSHYHCVEVVGE